MTPTYPALAPVLAALTRDDTYGADLTEFWQIALAPTASELTQRLVVTDTAVATVLETTRVPGVRCGGVGPMEWTVTTVEEAWERLVIAGVLPPDSQDATVRMFGRAALQEPWRALPERLAAFVAWASLGMDRIQHAEELAREADHRLVPWGRTPARRRIVWHVAPWDEVFPSAGSYFWGRAVSGLHGIPRDVIRRGDAAADAWANDRPALRQSLLCFAVAFDVFWRHASATGHTVTVRAETATGELLHNLTGLVNVTEETRIADLPNPFAPVLALGELGVVLESFESAALVLRLAPPGSAR